MARRPGNRVPPNRVERRSAGLRPASTAERRSKPRTAVCSHGTQARERRPPVGTAARRAAAAWTLTVGMAPFSARTPEDRVARRPGNRVPPNRVERARQRSAGLRPASTAERRSKPRTANREKSAGTARSAGVHTGIARERETRTDGAASSPVRVPPAPIPDGATTHRFPLPGAADAASGTPAWRPAGQGPSHREQVPEDGEPHRHRDAQRAPYEP